MGTRSGMGAFLENPMFLFVDDAEPILPIFRTTYYGETGRIVELADVGCDTETTFPMRFPRGAISDRRRGGAESHESIRRVSKRRNDKPNGFARGATDVNNNEVRNRRYVRGTARRDEYNDVYMDDLTDYDNSESLYDDLELLRNDSTLEAEDDNYYAQFVNPRNAIARSRRERIPRYDYSRDLESSFAQSVGAAKKESASPRWFVKNDGENVRETGVQLGERKKRTKTLLRTNGSFSREAEFGKTRETAVHCERDFPNADPIAPTQGNIFWDFISFGNDAECEGTTSCNLARTKNHSELPQKAPRVRRSYVFDSQPKRVDSKGEEEFKEMLEKDRRENLSSETPVNSARHRTSKDDTIKERPKILRLNTSNAISSRGQSMKAPVDERISNVYPAEKNSVDMRPHSTVEGKKIKSQAIERRKEIASATRTIVDARRYRDKFDKLPDDSPKEAGRSTRSFNRIADSRNNERAYTANERDSANPHRENSRNRGKIDRTNVVVSRLGPEEKETRNERTFALRMTAAPAPRADVEKAKETKFFSRLPVRTWKRLRTREPAASRPKNDAANGDVSRQGVENGTARSNGHSGRVENDDVRVKDRAAASRSDVKRSERFGTGSPGADKPPGLTPSVSKDVKGLRGSNAPGGTQGQHRKKGTSVK